MSSAEAAYLFRHALLRDAAYQLQMPADRARLHGLAFAVIEGIFDAPPTELPPLDAPEAGPVESHPSDSRAAELARHARNAGRLDEPSWRAAEIRSLRRAAEHAERHSLREEAFELWKRHAELSTGAERGECLRKAGFMAFGSARPAVAEDLYRQAIALHREAGHRRLEGFAVACLAHVLQETGRWKEAAPMFEEALRISREAGDRATEVYALKQHAWLQCLTGHASESRATYLLALETARAAGDTRREFALLIDLTAVDSHLGRAREVEEDLRGLLADPRCAELPAARGVILGNLSSILFQAGRAAEAEPLLLQALACVREAGNRFPEGVLLGGMAEICAGDGRMEDALRFRRQALDVHREMAGRHQEGIHLGALGHYLAVLGRTAEADAHFDEALAILCDVGDPAAEGAARCDRAIHSVATGRFLPAREEWTRGARLLREFGGAVQLGARVALMREACAKAGISPLDAAGGSS